MRRASSTARGCAKKAAFTSVRKNPGAVALAAIPFSPSLTARARINELVLAALDMAVEQRRPADVIHHRGPLRRGFARFRCQRDLAFAFLRHAELAF